MGRPGGAEGGAHHALLPLGEVHRQQARAVLELPPAPLLVHAEPLLGELPDPAPVAAVAVAVQRGVAERADGPPLPEGLEPDAELLGLLGNAPENPRRWV